MFKENMSFRDVEDYILEIPKFTTKNNFSDTLKFYEFLGCPGSAGKIIHVAGTNGKGSVCAFLESLLLKSGHSCGLFSSPHLVTMRERMRIGREMIREEEFVAVFFTLMKKCEEYKSYRPTFFELLFFMTMLWFEKKKPEYIILETGLGGRLDTTNVVKKKELCIITKIALDHTEYLGDTEEEIAKEKAGILKPATPVLYYHTKEETAIPIKTRGEEQKSCVIPFRDDFIQNIKKHEKFIDFSIFLEYYGYSDITVSSTGLYQVSNAGMALKAGEILLKKEMTPDMAAEAIKETVWPCRMEEVLPGVIVDGAHNPDGIEAFLKSVSENQERKILLFSVVSDKDYTEMISRLIGMDLFEKIILTSVGGKRALKADKLLAVFPQEFKSRIQIEEDPESAFRYALGEREGRTLYVAGSLYLAGLVKGLCEEEFK